MPNDRSPGSTAVPRLADAPPQVRDAVAAAGLDIREVPGHAGDTDWLHVAATA
jgi:hypothetical protein